MRINKYGIELVGEERLPQLVTEGTYSMSGENLTDPNAVASFCRNSLRINVKAEEYVYAIFLDTRGNIIGVSEISHGGVNAAPLSIREVYMRALLTAAVQIILVHNHPSTNVDPSMADEAITRRIYDAGDLIGIHLLDSVIIGGDNYYSFRENQNVFPQD
ncbi:MAG: JAB domain-containing protein [Lachnospiraceae bacterium]|nr:JAB domain-containing protein [Lachnospiraceae bacterium]